MRKAGGIVLATTNCSELGCHMETINLIHGRTNNPYDTSRTTGGSSGGEAAIIAAAGSVIGLGNDISGSVRIPNHYCCLFGHKPSRDLVSNSGSIPPPPVIAKYILTPGPICRYAEDLVLMMRLLSPENKEIFNDGNEVDFKKLKIFYHKGLMSDSCIRKPDQEIIDAIHNTASHFRKTYESVVEEINIPHLNKATLIFIYLMQEGISDAFEHLTLGRVKNLNSILEMVKWIFGMSHWTFCAIMGYGISTIAYPNREEDISNYKILRREVIEAFENILDENSVFLYPTFPVAAPLHYASLGFVPNIAYTNIFNITGMPVTQCPMGLNKKGLPIGIQIAGRINNDRLTLACAKELEKIFGGWIRPDKVNVNMKRI